MSPFTQLPSLRALVDLARGHLRRDDLPALVMSDPGSHDYVVAYHRVLVGGVPALLELHEGVPLHASFDITENLLLSHTDAGKSVRHRWFSLLTACIELLGWDGWEGPRGVMPSQSLLQLLTDSFALRDDDAVGAPLQLLPALCVELQRACSHRHERMAMLLGELLAAELSADDAEAKCLELQRCHDEFQVWGDESGEMNPWYAERAELVWGVLVRTKSELRSWLDLVSAHFPSSSPIARETRERLLVEGSQWRRAPRR